MKNLILSVFMSLGIYIVLTIPHTVAILTMDIDTGHYYGLRYPLWLILLISVVSSVIGNLIVTKLEK
jgi:hypothetical protein